MFDFGPFPQGSGRRHAVLAKLVQHLGKKSVRVLEVGSWTGQSALVWANAIDAICPDKGSVLCFDLWAPYASAEDVGKPIYCGMNDMLENGEAFSLFLRNIGLGPTGVPINFVRGRLSSFVELLTPQFDIIYIDGSHYLQDVKDDIVAARKLVAPGGIICGDDLELQGYSVDLEKAAKLNVDYTAEAGPGGPYHPGVTVAVWEAFGPVWERVGVWAMQRGAVSRDFEIPTIKE